MLAYPITLSPIGGLQLSDDPLRDRILTLLECRYWERVMLPDYGNPLFPFDPVSGSIGEFVAQLELAIGYWIGDQIRVEVLSNNADLEDGSIQVAVYYGESGGVLGWTIDRGALGQQI